MTSKFFNDPIKLILFVNTNLCEIGGPDAIRFDPWPALTQQSLCPCEFAQKYIHHFRSACHENIHLIITLVRYICMYIHLIITLVRYVCMYIHVFK